MEYSRTQTLKATRSTNLYIIDCFGIGNLLYRKGENFSYLNAFYSHSTLKSLNETIPSPHDPV